MGTYPIELRSRILAAHLEGAPLREIADRFMVSVGFVHGVVSRFRMTGQIEPGTRGCAHWKLTSDDEGALVHLVRDQPDATLEELRNELHRTRHVSLTKSGVHRALDRLGLTYKKRRCEPQSNRARTFTGLGSPFCGAFIVETPGGTSSSTNSA